MDSHFNHLGQPIGRPIPNWTPPPFPPKVPMIGRTCRLEPLSHALHTTDLYDAFSRDSASAMWTYLPVGPFATEEEYGCWVREIVTKPDPQFYAIIDSATGKAIGSASFMRIVPQHGCIEVGHLAFSPLLQKTTAATEAMYLMMRQAFDLGYRRYEWKCHSLNAPSRAAAERLGFTFEGVFRQAVVVKGHNRDTAWYSIIDAEWPQRKMAFEKWLDPANFDSSGRQIIKLRDV